MRAAVVPSLGAPLEIRELPVPEPGPGQVLVRIEASGLCHTDIHAARGDWPVTPTAPFVPGHEGVGRVVALGAGRAASGRRHPGRAGLAGLRLRVLPLLPVRLGDALPGAAEHRLLDRRRLRRIRRRGRPLRGTGARRHRPDGRRSADLRRRHHL